ncbi:MULTISPECIES: hypothetical protein [Mycolicibacterium]|uniref:Uncharacterized protein n=1 Tax=Mycolicibacterium llatzerense TaxID=280871 RepID=A0A0D1IZB3_9MYCO|nr:MULTISPECIES: hypothetical protein [Mycolicibacterium]KIU14598.1 hypothetical protein TL10_23280 [Mycolicibacterium llatzerense]MCT7372092.1 hypothetical protein [Mycolicibacterium llatzerense]WGI35882.1 hypothetical protein QDT91_27715 [Mycolicibacterium aubagnense]
MSTSAPMSFDMRSYPFPPPPGFPAPRTGIIEKLLARVFDRRRIGHDVAPYRPQDGGVMRTSDGAVYIPEATPPVLPIMGFTPRHTWRQHAMANRSQIQALDRYVNALSTELRSASTHLPAADRQRVLTLIGDTTTGDGTW